MDVTIWEAEGCLQCACEEGLKQDRTACLAIMRTMIVDNLNGAPARYLDPDDFSGMADRMSLGAYRRMQADMRSALLSPHECGLTEKRKSDRRRPYGDERPVDCPGCGVEWNEALRKARLCSGVDLKPEDSAGG